MSFTVFVSYFRQVHLTGWIFPIAGPITPRLWRTHGIAFYVYFKLDSFLFIRPSMPLERSANRSTVFPIGPKDARSSAADSPLLYLAARSQPQASLPPHTVRKWSAMIALALMLRVLMLDKDFWDCQWVAESWRGRLNCGDIPGVKFELRSKTGLG